LTPKERAPVFSRWEAVRAPEPVWMLQRRGEERGGDERIEEKRREKRGE
jgi:hypothetical protein